MMVVFVVDLLRSVPNNAAPVPYRDLPSFWSLFHGRLKMATCC